MTYNPFMFGNSVACVKLAAALQDESSHLKRRVSNHIHEFNEGLNELSLVEPDRLKSRLGNLWIEDFITHDLNSIRKNVYIDELMQNVLRYRYRLWLEKHRLINKQQLHDRSIKNERGRINAEKWVEQNIP